MATAMAKAQAALLAVLVVAVVAVGGFLLYRAGRNLGETSENLGSAAANLSGAIETISGGVQDLAGGVSGAAAEVGDILKPPGSTGLAPDERAPGKPSLKLTLEQEKHNLVGNWKPFVDRDKRNRFTFKVTDDRGRAVWNAKVEGRARVPRQASQGSGTQIGYTDQDGRVSFDFRSINYVTIGDRDDDYEWIATSPGYNSSTVVRTT